MIAAPVAMPATYQSHVQPKFTDAYLIIVAIASSRKIEPSKRNARTRKIIPANPPATANAAKTNGSHGELATPLMKMSAVDDAQIVVRHKYRTAVSCDSENSFAFK